MVKFSIALGDSFRDQAGLWKNGFTRISRFLPRAVWAAGITLLLTLQTAAAENLLEMYRLALEKDPVYQQARFSNLASRERLNQARSRFLPSLSLEAEAGRTRQDIIESHISLYKTGLSSFGSSRLSLTLNQPLLQWSALAGLRQARAETKRADSEFRQAEQDLILRLATAYFQALAAQDELAFTETEYSSLKRHHETVQIQRVKGLASLPDFYDSQSRLAAVEAHIMEAQDTWDDAAQMLREICGVLTVKLGAVGENMELVGPDPPDVEPWIQTALERNPELQAQRQTVEISRREVDRLKSERYPVLDMVVRGGKDQSGGSVFGGGSDIETASAVVRLSVPLYEGGILNSRISEAHLRFQAASQEEIRLTRSIERRTRTAFYGVTRAAGRVVVLEKALQSQELALEAKKEGFRSGTSSSLDVLDAERDCFQMRRDYARARYEYVLNSFRLKQIIGNLSEMDILAVNNWLR